jgi:3-hydroxybutyryl-CoA dehydratase
MDLDFFPTMEHPNEYTFEEIKVGDSETFEKAITKEDIATFSTLTGDKNPLHLDKNYAEGTEFKKPVAFGMLYSSFLSTLAGMYLPGKYSLIMHVELDLPKPVFEGDVITISGTVDNKINVGKMVKLTVSMKNRSSQEVLKGSMLVKVLK